MNELLHNITSDEDMFVPLIVFLSGTIITVVAIVFSAIRKIEAHHSSEKSRREIAAYIAEGSMTPEDGERLLNAGRKGKD